MVLNAYSQAGMHTRDTTFGLLLLLLCLMVGEGIRQQRCGVLLYDDDERNKGSKDETQRKIRREKEREMDGFPIISNI